MISDDDLHADESIRLLHSRLGSTCSQVGAGGRSTKPNNFKRGARVLLSLIAFFLSCSPDLSAQVHLTKDEALKLYFPPPLSIERKTLFLTDHEVERIQKSARTKVESKVVTYYVGRGRQGVDGYAFFETHIVRTMPATYMIVINPDSTVRAVEILAFYEPEDYLPPKRWLELFRRKALTNDLWLKRGMQNIVGATLSAQALTDAVRKYLALFELAIPKEKNP